MRGFVDDYLPALLAQASHLVSAEFHAVVRRAGLSVAQWRVLATLASAAPEAAYATGELAQVTITKQPTLSRLLERLAARGLVQRRDDEEDRRFTRVAITPAGRRLVQRLMAQAAEHERRVLEPFGPRRAAELKRVLRGLIERQRAGA